MFPVGIIIMLTDYGRQFLWTTSIFLALQSVILILALRHLANLRSVLISACLIFDLSFVIELIGVRYSFPFGAYSYTYTLYPLIKGAPPTIAFAWFAVTASSFLIAKLFLGNANAFVISFVSAILILATDILLEPFASFANGFWLWEGGKVPIQNFASWFGIGFVFSLIMEKFIKWDEEKIKNKKLFIIPVIVFSMNVLNFSVINMVSGYFLFTFIGLALVGAEMLLIINIGNNEA